MAVTLGVPQHLTKELLVYVFVNHLSYSWLRQQDV